MGLLTPWDLRGPPDEPFYLYSVKFERDVLVILSAEVSAEERNTFPLLSTLHCHDRNSIFRKLPKQHQS